MLRLVIKTPFKFFINFNDYTFSASRCNEYQNKVNNIRIKEFILKMFLYTLININLLFYED